MELEFANITLISATDLILAKRQIIREDEIKQMTVKMLVEPGAHKMTINETIRVQLHLPLIEKRKYKVANGSIKEFNIVGPIKVIFKNRSCILDAMVLSGDNEPLPGSMPACRISQTTVDYLTAGFMKL